MSDDEHSTEIFSHRRFIAPVDTVDELPMEGPPSGLLCMVSEECAIYEKVDGEWRMWVTTDLDLD